MLLCYVLRCCAHQLQFRNQSAERTELPQKQQQCFCLRKQCCEALILAELLPAKQRPVCRSVANVSGDAPTSAHRSQVAPLCKQQCLTCAVLQCYSRANLNLQCYFTVLFCSSHRQCFSLGLFYSAVLQCCSTVLFCSAILLCYFPVLFYCAILQCYSRASLQSTTTSKRGSATSSAPWETDLLLPDAVLQRLFGVALLVVDVLHKVAVLLQQPVRLLLDLQRLREGRRGKIVLFQPASLLTLCLDVVV